jgi:cyclohexadienyl dehydratase
MGRGALRGFAALLFGAWLAAAAPAHAGDRLDDIVARGTLRVALTGDYRPFSIKGGDGGMAGLDVDLAGSLAASLGVKLEIVPTTWGTLLADLAADRYDIAMGGITITLARQRVAYFSAPVMGTGKTPIARCADRDRFATLAQIDRPGVRVIVNPGGTNERFARANIHAAEIVVFPDNAHIFDELAAGHADVMITDAVETRVQQKLHPELCAIHPDAPFDHAELGYLLPRDISWKLYVDQWLHQQQDTGAWRQTAARYID